MTSAADDPPKDALKQPPRRAFRLVVGENPSSSAQRLAAIHARAFASGGAGAAWPPRAFDDLMLQPRPIGVVCVWAELFDVNHVVAFAITRVVSDEAEILTICREPSIEGSGAGAKMLRGVEAVLRGGPVLRLFLEVGVDNTAARRLYDNRGFREVGRRRGYYDNRGGPRRDAILMEKCLTQLE